MKSLTGSVVGALAANQVIKIKLISANRGSYNMQCECLGREWLIMLGFPEVVSPSSNSGETIHYFAIRYVSQHISHGMI